MNLKNFFNLLLISAIFVGVSSCDLEGDEPIEGSWVYRGVYKVEVNTNHPSLTRAIELDIAEEAKDYEHALVFDGEKMMRMYGYELNFSAYYRYRRDELTLNMGNYNEVYQFDINGDIALWRISYVGDYAYSDSYIDEEMLYYLMNEYSFLRRDLAGVDLNSLQVRQVDIFKKYQKIDQ